MERRRREGAAVVWRNELIATMLRAVVAAAFACALGFMPRAFALDAATVAKLATGDGDEKAAAIVALVASGDERAAVVLRALADGEVQVAAGRVLIVTGDSATDA